MSAEMAHDAYGVVLTGDGYQLDLRATEENRENLRRNRKALPQYDFGEMKTGGKLHATD